jgi:D-alanyl-D-alanine carboxypeptidase
VISLDAVILIRSEQGNNIILLFLVFIYFVFTKPNIMKTIKTILFFGILIANLISSPSFSQGPPEKGNTLKTAKLLQSRLDSVTTKQLIPGATLSVRFKDGTKISLASGLSDVENKTPMKPDAVMFSGSVGKTYVAAVVLKLYEKGLIDLKAKATDYLKDEPWFLKIPNAADITVEMLLNHTAGVPEYVYHTEVWQAMKDNPDKVWTVEERLSFVYADPPSNAPGKGWAYADSHYLVLGLIIEKITGKTYYDVLRDYILKPCKLKQTVPSDKRTIPGLIPGYTGMPEQFLLPRKMLNNNLFAFNPQMEWTGGGLATTVSDLTLWATQLYGGDVLKPESKKLMFTPAPFKTILPEGAGYGLGCFIGKTNGRLYYGHSGFMPGYITIVQYIPEYGISIAFQFNTDGPERGFSPDRFFNVLKKVVLENMVK